MPSGRPGARGVSDVLSPRSCAYGASGEHEGFPGTVSIGSTALTTVLVELVRSATRTFSRVVLVSGHGGNLDGVRAALAVLRQERRDAVGWFPRGARRRRPRRPDRDVAAARDRTAPGPPGALDRGATEPLAELMPRLRSVGVGR